MDSYTTLKLKCLHDLEDLIQTHNRGCFTRGKDFLRLSYQVGVVFKYIILTREEAPDFLKKHGIIDQVAVTTTGIKMYTKALITVADHRGRPVQSARYIPLEWEALTLNASQVHSIAARHEWNELGKVIQIGTILKRA